MKIRLLSDLHIDVNASHTMRLENKDDFVLIAGDTSGNPEITEQWLNKNVKNGIFIAGNHLVYNKKNQTILDLKKYLGSKFTLDSDITFLDSEIGIISKEVNGILFVGTTLYTDYNLNNHAVFDMQLGKAAMNDFRWGIKSKKSNGEIIRLTPDDYLEYFHKSINMMEEVISRNELEGQNTKPVIILTHHCPSQHFISKKFETSMYNASYVSDLDYFIEKHKSIKLWLCGHIHSRVFSEFKREDGSVVKLVANPRGYVSYSEDYNWTKNVYVDTDTWEVYKTGKKLVKTTLI